MKRQIDAVTTVMIQQWRDAADRRERLGQKVTAMFFRNEAFRLEQELKAENGPANG